MEFVELLTYAKEYRNELNTLSGLRTFLERIKDFEEYQLDYMDLLRVDLDIDESSKIIDDGDYYYYSDIYEYVDEYLNNSGLNSDIPYWLSIDYDKTFNNIRCGCQISYTDAYSPFIIYY